MRICCMDCIWQELCVKLSGRQLYVFAESAVRLDRYTDSAEILRENLESLYTADRWLNICSEQF